MTGTTAGPVVVVGGGLAGWTLVRELRQRAPALAIRLVCSDDGHFYSKPMLSNALAQKKDAAQLVQRQAPLQAQAQGVQLLARRRITAIDTDAQRLETAGDPLAGTVPEPIPYGTLVLALGADPIRPPTAGIEHALSVNDIDDYARFRAALGAAGSGAHVVTIGGGLIGSEFANDLALAGYAVSVIDPVETLIGSLVPPEQGKALQAALEALGVRFYLGDLAVSIEPRAQGGYRLALRTGRNIEADLVLSAVGLRPRMQLASEAGLATGRGIIVDVMGRTSDPHIYALGDCAAYTSAARPAWFDGAARPLPYVLPIMTAARAIAATLAGEPTPIRFGAMPVRVKTPALPLTIAG